MALGTNLSLPATRKARRRRGGRDADQRLFVAVTLVPTLLGLLVFWIYPLANGLLGSFTDWQAFASSREFIGLDNYRALRDDPVFVKALGNTGLYTLMYLPLNVAIGLVLAMAVEGSGKLRGLFRTVYFLPVVASAIATALMWKWLYQPSLGLFNQILDLVGLPTQSYLASTTQALPSIVAYSLWKNVGLTMVLFMAGLNGIDRSYYEAARVDGAGRLRLFWGITVPLLRPTLVFVVITGIIETLQVFGPVFILSSVGANSPPGGPANSTMVVAVYQWAVAFGQLNLGYGMAMGMVLFVIILGVTLTQARFLRQSWEY
ncbi:MAG: N-acetyl-D-glucosamine ABC transporter, permease protein 1 [uncultured Thermomicrobiales bacterium]|uniref:N-acetyl-D-glucosamine ABC transporter, permease protein 1 n=1 Tax=uncultured Thermomicrobiales bacterium TaxID=1645740 RepID=A0A6J4TY85_9BACT|nr:MAG: N-acetyl-D-glucosamine ABC transporter, permease protein 1 [uncultured Thermomicrobiales bacterium]